MTVLCFCDAVKSCWEIHSHLDFSSCFQDLPGACSVTDLHEALSLSEVGDRRLFLVGTQAVKGQASLTSGVQDAWDLIVLVVGETVC